jgi:hypothetical protein
MANTMAYFSDLYDPNLPSSLRLEVPASVNLSLQPHYLYKIRDRTESYTIPIFILATRGHFAFNRNLQFSDLKKGDDKLKSDERKF